MIPAFVAHVLISVQQFVNSFADQWTDFNELIVARFGVSGQWVLWGAVAFGALYVTAKAAGLAFNLTRYVILPSAILTVASIMLMPSWEPTRTFALMTAATGTLTLLRSK